MEEGRQTADVVAAMDDAEVDFDSSTAWDEHMRVIERLLDALVDAEWVQVDPGRLLNPVSGTAVRADVEGYWWALAPCVRASLTQRVVVLGAESTGTTTLARALADELGTLRVEEYGREYSEIRPGGFTAPWRSDEFDLVVDRQIALSRRRCAASRARC